MKTACATICIPPPPFTTHCLPNPSSVPFPAKRSEEHTSELQSRENLVCRLLLRRPPGPTLFAYTTLFRSLRHVLRAKAVLCPGLSITFYNEEKDETDHWLYEDGLRDYLHSATAVYDPLPAEPFVGSFSSE